jgi:hypothetical protein
MLEIVQFLALSFRQLELAMGYCQQIVDRLKKSNPAIQPEYMIPLLIYLLTHRPNLEEDLPDLPTFGIYFKNFSEPPCVFNSNAPEYPRAVGIARTSS